MELKATAMAPIDSEERSRNSVSRIFIKAGNCVGSRL